MFGKVFIEKTETFSLSRKFEYRNWKGLTNRLKIQLVFSKEYVCVYMYLSVFKDRRVSVCVHLSESITEMSTYI